MLDRKLTRRVSEELGVSERAVERIYMEYLEKHKEAHILPALEGRP